LLQIGVLPLGAGLVVFGVAGTVYGLGVLRGSTAFTSVAGIAFGCALAFLGMGMLWRGVVLSGVGLLVGGIALALFGMAALRDGTLPQRLSQWWTEFVRDRRPAGSGGGQNSSSLAPSGGLAPTTPPRKEASTAGRPAHSSLTGRAVI
jgi:hypothetical protein